MERKLINGEYVPNGAGGLTTLEGAQEVLARVLFRLTARRGGLSFRPNLGSHGVQPSGQVTALHRLQPRTGAELLQHLLINGLNRFQLAVTSFFTDPPGR